MTDGNGDLETPECETGATCQIDCLQETCNAISARPVSSHVNCLKEPSVNGRHTGGFPCEVRTQAYNYGTVIHQSPVHSRHTTTTVNGTYSTEKSHKAVSAYLKSKQILPSGFAEQCYIHTNQVVNRPEDLVVEEVWRAYNNGGLKSSSEGDFQTAPSSAMVEKTPDIEDDEDMTSPDIGDEDMTSIDIEDGDMTSQYACLLCGKDYRITTVTSRYEPDIEWTKAYSSPCSFVTSQHDKDTFMTSQSPDIKATSRNTSSCRSHFAPSDTGKPCTHNVCEQCVEDYILKDPENNPRPCPWCADPIYV